MVLLLFFEKKREDNWPYFAPELAYLETNF